MKIQLNILKAVFFLALTGNTLAETKLNRSESLAQLETTAGQPITATIIQTPTSKRVDPSPVTDEPARKMTFKPGDIVLQNESFRIVESVDPTGIRVVLKANQYYMRARMRSDEISLVVPSFGGYKAGDAIIYHPQTMKLLWADSPRVIEAVDDTGRVVLAADEYFVRSYTRVESIRRPER